MFVLGNVVSYEFFLVGICLHWLGVFLQYSYVETYQLCCVVIMREDCK